MADGTFDRLSATTSRVSSELELPSANVFLGAKSNENAVVASVTVALAASATTDGMEAYFTCLDGQGNRIPRVHALEVWISESAVGAGLTADSYSGTVTFTTGTALTVLTAKKHWSIVTSASGQATMLAVDSANPVDQYVAAKNPTTGRVHVSSSSGANWEGA